MKKVSGLIVLLGICTSYSQVLYNINFDAPAQPANHVVLTGPAPNFVTHIYEGSPMVVPAFGGLVHQPLQFDMVGNQPLFYYDQIELDMPQIHPPAIDVSFDFTSSGLVGSRGRFVMLFDTPSVRNIEFDRFGVIWANQPSVPDTTFGSFTNGETFHFATHLDLVNHQMSVFKNGVLLGTAPFTPADYISDIRFSYGLQTGVGGPDAGGVGIDNILVVAVPEPGSLSFVAGIGAVVWWNVRFNGRKRS
jgi:hypothetical protein